MPQGFIYLSTVPKKYVLSMSSRIDLNEKWIKAAVIGTTWAASEIVLGSFFHNLRIPFSSNILTGIGIIILISSSYLWVEKGIFWRAGLICAIMKTMSPSAVIFGPMIAIFSQALMLELAVRLFQRTILGYAIGAMLAMTWNLVQKIFKMLIFYGSNIVDVYTGLLKFAQKQLHSNIDFVWLPLVLLLIIYCILGLIAAFVGIKVGRKLLHQKPVKFINKKSANAFNKKKAENNFNYSLRWLFVDFVFIITGLLMLNFFDWYIWTISIGLISIVWIFRYKRALRQLIRPRFWIYFIVITMLTAFVVNKIQANDLYSGILIGVQMNFRALIIILGFSVLGTELYNPVIRNYFNKTKFRQLPIALELSFESLPKMISSIPDVKVLIKEPIGVVFQIISQINFRLAEFKNEINAKVFIITGRVGAGKTSYIKELTEDFNSKEIKICGIYANRVMNNEQTVGYDLIDIATGTAEVFLRINNNCAANKIGKYEIFSKALALGIRRLNSLKNSDVNTIVIDEIGKLELNGQGWASVFNDLIKNTDKQLIITVRDSFVNKVIDKWNIQNYEIINVENVEQKLLAKENIMKAVIN